MLSKTRSNLSKSVMVSVGVSALGCTELIFVDPGVKIDGAYYRDVLLSQHLLPQIKEISGEFFTFQQDSAPAYRAPAALNSRFHLSTALTAKQSRPKSSGLQDLERPTRA